MELLKQTVLASRWGKAQVSVFPYLTSTSVPCSLGGGTWRVFLFVCLFSILSRGLRPPPIHFPSLTLQKPIPAAFLQHQLMLSFHTSWNLQVLEHLASSCLGSSLGPREKSSIPFQNRWVPHAHLKHIPGHTLKPTLPPSPPFLKLALLPLRSPGAGGRSKGRYHQR